MGLRATLDRLSSSFAARGRFSRYRALFEMVDRFLYTPGLVTADAPHVRDAMSVQRVMMCFVIASVPCWLIGLWNLGHQIAAASALVDLSQTAHDGWLTQLGFSISPESVGGCLVLGFAYWLPLFVTALLTGVFWEVTFATVRGKSVDHGLLTIAWFFTLLLPASAPLHQVVIGMSFGVVVGKLVFGGTGRYPVNPAVLGIAFLFIAYPDLVFGKGTWVPVPGVDAPTALDRAAHGGLDALEEAGYGWSQLFLGEHPGAIGVTSTLGCVLGAIYLAYTGVASLRIMLGSVLGLIVALLLFNAVTSIGVPLLGVPWYWHAVLGGFAFGAVFLATDPTASAMTHAGRWAFGVLVGVIAVVLRLSEPAYTESVLYAILLASLFAPTFDFVAVELNMRRRRRRLEEEA